MILVNLFGAPSADEQIVEDVMREFVTDENTTEE